MDVIQSLIERNGSFAKTGFNAALKIMPTKKTMILGCVDPRVDPVEIFNLTQGEAAVIRNVGGRIDALAIQTLELLQSVVEARGGVFGPGWNLIVLHHTDCGIVNCLSRSPDRLAKQMGVATAALDSLAISNPHDAVALDVAALKASPDLPGALVVTGMVYDVATGVVQTVVPPAPVRAS
jgi:carbonic anhydrase